MKKIYKNINIALIFMLFIGGGLAYSSDMSHLRVPLIDNKREEDALKVLNTSEDEQKTENVIDATDYVGQCLKLANELRIGLKEGHRVSLQIGSNRYHIVSEIKAGGARRIFKARRIKEEGTVASYTLLKFYDSFFLSAMGIDYSEFESFFDAISDDKRAYSLFARLLSDNIGYTEFENLGVLEMEFVDGIALSEIKDSPERHLAIIAKLVGEFAYVQGKYKIFHGDLHANNILITSSNKPKLIDWEYLAVFLYLLDKDISDIRAACKYKDIYYIGDLIYQVYCPQSTVDRPGLFTGNNYRNIEDIDVTRWRGITKLKDVQGIPAGILRIIKKAMLADPKSNYESLDELYKDLSIVLTSQEILNKIPSSKRIDNNL